MTSTPQTASLHATYCGLTHLNVSLNMTRIWIWDRWIFEGFSEADLRSVILLLQAKNRSGGKYSLGFERLIRDTSWFGEQLAEARSKSRVKPQPARESVLRATGRPEAQTPEAIAAGERAVEILRSFRAR
jgi:hypothetical protein